MFKYQIFVLHPAKLVGTPSIDGLTPYALRPILCVPIIRILRATIGTYLKKSFLCAPICANFEISILKRSDIFRIDLIIVAIIRSTRYSQKKN